MNEYKSLLQTLWLGGGLGSVGFALGVLVIKSIAVKDAIKYLIVAVISGAVAFHFAGQSPYENYDFYIAIGAGWGFFFFLKGLTKIMERFANEPVKTIFNIVNNWRGKK